MKNNFSKFMAIFSPNDRRFENYSNSWRANSMNEEEHLQLEKIRFSALLPQTHTWNPAQYKTFFDWLTGISKTHVLQFLSPDLCLSPVPKSWETVNEGNFCRLPKARDWIEHRLWWRTNFCIKGHWSSIRRTKKIINRALEDRNSLLSLVTVVSP